MFLKDRVFRFIRRSWRATALAVTLLLSLLAGQALLTQVGIIATVAFVLIVPGGALVTLVLLPILARKKEHERRWQLVWEEYERKH